MRKIITVFSCFFLGGTGFSMGEMLEWNHNYEIVSDSFSSEVPAGKCLVTGRIMIPAHDTVWAKPVAFGLVATTNQKKSTTTDIDGFYSLMISEKDSGIFFFNVGMAEIVVSEFDFLSQHHVVINFYPGRRYNITVVDKPVIYLYSDARIESEITFSCKGDLTFSYPEYNSGWQMTVDQNGMADSKSGQSYPYLFWEAKTDQLNFETKNEGLNGFVVNTDTLVSFLENSLTVLGLNEKEQTDFITFWIPKMSDNKFVLIQFLIDDAYAKSISEMNISPQPDAMRRVFMLWSPVESEDAGIPVTAQNLTSFERFGFTVVEWGGSEIDLMNVTQ